MANRHRIPAALTSALESLKLARRELDHVAEDSERWRWVVIGLVASLKSALLVALSSYETADEADVADLKDPRRVAPLALLLRRAQSDRYLMLADQLTATASQINAVLALAAYRNAAIHGGDATRPEAVENKCGIALDMIAHFLIERPAFDISEYAVLSALIADEVSAVSQRLSQIG